MKTKNAFLSIYKREMSYYFFSPVAYIVAFAFMAILGWLFFGRFFITRQADMREFFNLLPISFVFLVPALSMHLLSEEYSSGTIEMLATLPIKAVDIVLGKFLALFTFLAILLLPTFAYAFTIELVGDLDWGPVIGGYFGALFLCAAFSALGLFTSSLSKNQIISYLLALIVGVMIIFLDQTVIFLPSFIKSWLTGLLQYLTPDYHFQNVARGVFDIRDVIYFVSVVFVLLLGTQTVLEERSRK